MVFISRHALPGTRQCRKYLPFALYCCREDEGRVGGGGGWYFGATLWHALHPIDSKAFMQISPATPSLDPTLFAEETSNKKRSSDQKYQE